MTARDVTFVVNNLRDLPALPSVVLDLISAFGRDDVDVTTLADKMSMDQGMAAKILRIANSSFYGLAGKVRTVRQAVLVLGFDNARALAVGRERRRGAPGERGRREVPPFVPLGEPRRAVGAVGDRRQVAVEQRVVHAAEPRLERLLGVPR